MIQVQDIVSTWRGKSYISPKSSLVQKSQDKIFLEEFLLSEIIPPKCICMDLFSSLVYKAIQVHTHTNTFTQKNAPFFKLTAIFLLITPTRSCLLTCLLYSSLKDSKLFKEFLLLFSYFQYYLYCYYSFLFLHQWLKYRNIAYYSTNATLLLLLLVIVSQSWITHVCADFMSRSKVQDGFIAFSCI